MLGLERIQKTRDYLDYLEEHLNNVQKAWKELEAKCSKMRFVYDDFVYWTIDSEVKHHDLSKFSEHEFCFYRNRFFPFKDEEVDKNKFETAWEHHKKANEHHWENWTKMETSDPYTKEIHCVHMVIDWMAMGYKFGDTAEEFYESNKHKIELPNWAVKFIYEIFEATKAPNE